MSVDDPRQPLSPHVIMAVIQRLVEEGNITISRHMKVRMRQRHFEMADVFNVFEYGQVKRAPQWNPEYHNWEYDVEGIDIEGESLTIRVAIDPGQEMLTLVTGF
jgi:hypothetical protein